MGLLDKLKPQPRWRHPDASVRLDALKELDDVVELSALAESDPEARVRRAAVGRIDDPVLLGRVAAADSDESVRNQAAEALQALATSATDASVGLLAVRGIADPRQLSAVARSSGLEAVCAAALARIEDVRALGAIARHAPHAAIAAAALAKLTDPAECLDVALNSDHKDVALAAVEIVVPAGAGRDAIDLLTTIETRTQQKAVARRAKAMLQAIEAAEAARQAAVEERRRREIALCEDAEHLAAVTDANVVQNELARLDEAFRALGPSDDATASRFAAAAAAAREALVRREREAQEAAELARQRAEAIATRDALCGRVETLDGDDVCEQLIPIEEEWRSLMPLVGNGPEADRLAERFAQAVAACRKRHEMGAQLATVRGSLSALVAEAEGLPALEDTAAAAERWHQLSREARGLAATLASASRPAEDLAARWRVVEQVFDARALQAQEAELKAHQTATLQVQRLLERGRRVAEAESTTLREGERLMKDIAQALTNVAQVETTREIEDAVAGLRTVQEKIAPRVRELREMDEWRRFANAQRQEQLIAMAEAIVKALEIDDAAGTEPDLASTARALREMQAQWQTVAEAPRHSAQRLWERFRSSTALIRTRCEAYFAKARSERVENLQKRAAIVEEAETLAQSTDWGKAAARFQELQTAWQSTGGGSRDAGRELSQRFRTACNAFFARRREDLADRKKVWTENLARKEALCERAESLAESTEWESTAAEMKRLQAEWKTIGPVRRSKSEVVWARFRSAADRFFERFHNRHAIAAAATLAEREAIVVHLETLLGQEEAPADLAQTIQSLRSAWTQGSAPHGVDIRPLADRWQTAFAAIGGRWPAALKGTEFDPDVVRQRLEKLVAKVESFIETVEDPKAKGMSATELLAARLRSALASNAMGGRSTEDAKARAATEAVRDAQAAWQRLAPAGGDVARELEGRFREACRKVTEQTRLLSAPPPRRSPRTTAAAAV